MAVETHNNHIKGTGSWQLKTNNNNEPSVGPTTALQPTSLKGQAVFDLAQDLLWSLNCRLESGREGEKRVRRKEKESKHHPSR